MSYEVAEREGFEPSVPRKGYNGFRDRPDRPLWHLSGAPARRIARGTGGRTVTEPSAGRKGAAARSGAVREAHG